MSPPHIPCAKTCDVNYNIFVWDIYSSSISTVCSLWEYWILKMPLSMTTKFILGFSLHCVEFNQNLFLIKFNCQVNIFHLNLNLTYLKQGLWHYNIKSFQDYCMNTSFITSTSNSFSKWRNDQILIYITFLNVELIICVANFVTWKVF